MAHTFDYTLSYAELDLRKHPELYRVGRGEQGVLLVQPYKSEILPLWKFRTPEIARKSAGDIYLLYERYRENMDFVGMDMARKFLQMGWTRSMRYANHKTGKKYIGPVPDAHKGESGAWGRVIAPVEFDEKKYESAQIFKKYLETVRKDPIYASERKKHLNMYP